MKNGITLVTYADCMGNNLKDLNQVLKKYIGNGVDIIHILPFFPSTADRGFAPVRYDKVDEAFGDWEDISRIRENYKLTVDFMINHISRYSDYFNDFIEKKNASEYRDMFIQYKDFWDNGEPTKEQVDLLFKRKPRAPYTEVEFADGSVEKIWCTFSEDQIDLDFRTDITKKYIRDVLEGLCEKDISVIRLDAFAYTTKYKNTNCFFVEPYIWDVLAYCRQILEPHQVEILPELHGHYGKRLEIAQRGYYVYDYALPMLVLYSLYSGESKRLADWLRICPRKQFTTLDTHDGIGVIDVQDLLSTEEINYTTEKLYEVGANGEKEELSDYNVSAVKDEENQIYAVLGGSSESRSVDENGKETVETIGLTAGTKYVISATPFNKLLDGDGNLTGIVYGKETFGEVLTLNEPQKAKITLAADQKVYQVGRSENEKDEDGNVTEKIVMYDTYAASSVNFTAKADMAVSGTWVLDACS